MPPVRSGGGRITLRGEAPRGFTLFHSELGEQRIQDAAALGRVGEARQAHRDVLRVECTGAHADTLVAALPDTLLGRRLALGNDAAVVTCVFMHYLRVLAIDVGCHHLQK